MNHMPQTESVEFAFKCKLELIFYNRFVICFQNCAGKEWNSRLQNI